MRQREGKRKNARVCKCVRTCMRVYVCTGECIYTEKSYLTERVRSILWKVVRHSLSKMAEAQEHVVNASPPPSALVAPAPDEVSESEEETAAVLYSQKKEWKDVVPQPQDDGPHPSCPIAYSELCALLFLSYLLFLLILLLSFDSTPSPFTSRTLPFPSHSHLHLWIYLCMYVFYVCICICILI